MVDEIRGIESKQEQAAQQLARDTRPLGIRVAEFLCIPATNFVFTFSGIALCFIFPAVTDLIFLVLFMLFMFVYTRKSTLPFRLPESADVLDYNDLVPGTTKPRMSRGIAFFGNDRVTQEELWFSNDDLRTHVLIFGSTGSGKTEALISIACNALIQASGFIYIDGKGDNSLYAKIFSLVRSMGRDDDLLLINFMTGARDIIGPQEHRLSNTMNPFARGSSSMISNLATSLMDSATGGDSGADMWKGRAINFIESLMKILCYMRDKGVILLDAHSIREYFMLEKLEKMVVDHKFPVGDMEYDISDIPTVVMDPLRTYVLNLPGYNPKNRGRQAGEVLEQHGFITMQLTRAFGSLADTYGHILRTNLAEVDLKDVVLNRRILLVLLPALEKSPDELSNLGKIIIASLKVMMAAGLGDTVEGDYRDVVLRKPTNSRAPYMCIMDEYGYYAVKGFAVVPAQARSLGFSAIFAGQDLPAFQKAGKEEAASIGANCNIKICMKLEDPQDTWEYFNKVAGETYVTNVQSFQQNSGSLTVNYADSRTASVDRRQRIELLDLREQREGQCHIFFKSTIIRAEFFHADPKPVKRMRVGQFLKVETPPDHELTELDSRLKRFSKVLADPRALLPAVQPNEDILIIQDTLMHSPINLSPVERGVNSLVALLEHEIAKQHELSSPYEDVGLTDQMSAFTPIEATPLVTQMIGEENVELFSLPLIRRGSTMEDLKHIERLCGRSAVEADQAAQSILTDVEKVTEYPPNILMSHNKHKFMEALNQALAMLGGEQYYDSHMLGTAKLSAVPEADDASISTTDKLPDLPNLPEFPEFEDLESLLQDEFNKDEEEFKPFEGGEEGGGTGSDSGGEHGG
jgi:intracellular multiplication protein IcmO